MPNVELTTIAEFIAKLEASEPVESAQRQTKYFGESGFTTLTAAKASAAADYTEFGRITNFVIASDLAVSGTDNTGPHLVVKFEGNGRITTQNAGDIFTINRREGIGSKQVFFGPGRVQYAKGAANEMFNLGEWVPEPTTATPYPIIEANHWEGMRWSLYNNNGGRVWVPNNYYYTNEETEPQIGGFMGFGSTDGDGPEGPSANTKGPGIEQLTAGKSIFKIKPGARNVVIEGLRLTLPEGSSGSQVLIEGEFGVDPEVYGIEIERCTMTRGRSGVRVNDTSGAWSWLVMHVKVRRCEILHHTVASVETNTVNGQYTFESLDLTPVPNGTSMGFKFDKTGKVAIRDCNMNGVLQSPATKSFTFAPGDVNVAGKKIVKAGTGVASYDSIFLSNSGGDLPDGWSATVKYYVRVSGNDHTLHRNVADVTNNENAVDPVDQGTGTHTANSVRPNGDSSQPYCGIYIGGPHAGISVYDWQDEGVSRFIVAENTNDYANTIKLDNCFGQGQCYFKSTAQKLSVELVGGKYHWRSFHDEIGANVRLRNYGAKFYTYGDNGPINDYGGFACPVTPRFDDFIGGSYFARDDNDHRGNMSATRSNDTFFWGLEKIDPESNNELSLKAKRIASGVKAGWWKFVNSMFGVDNAQAGVDLEGGIAYAGQLMNARPADAADLSVGGEATFDLRLGHNFSLTTTTDRQLNFINGPADHTMLIEVNVLTSGTTSRNLTAGDNAVMQAGAFATGTVSGAHYVLQFYWNGTYAIEVGRNPGAGGGSVATDALWDAKGDLAAGTGSNTASKVTVGADDTFLVADTAQSAGVKWTDAIKQLIIRGVASAAIKIYDRAANATAIQIYSDVSGDVHIYRDLSAANIFSITGGNLMSLPSAVKAQFGQKYRTGGTASSATPTPNVDDVDVWVMTGATAAFEWQVPAGSPTDRQRLRLWAKDDGTTRAITYNAIYRAIGVTLPTATTANKWILWELEYDQTATKWNVINVREEV